jgi:hypothetical protein
MCPLVDPDGNTPVRFAVTEGPCPSLVDVLLQSSGDGGAGVEWHAQQRIETAKGCADSGPMRVGIANVDGACCATTVDVPMQNEGLTFRMTVQADWQAE